MWWRSMKVNESITDIPFKGQSGSFLKRWTDSIQALPDLISNIFEDWLYSYTNTNNELFESSSSPVFIISCLLSDSDAVAPHASVLVILNFLAVYFQEESEEDNWKLSQQRILWSDEIHSWILGLCDPGNEYWDLRFWFLRSGVTGFPAQHIHVGTVIDWCLFFNHVEFYDNSISNSSPRSWRAN